MKVINDKIEISAIEQHMGLTPIKRVRFGKNSGWQATYVEEVEFQDGTAITPKGIAQFITDLDNALLEAYEIAMKDYRERERAGNG